MNIYIDKANFQSLMLSRQERRFDDVLRIIKKQFNVFFNFEKNELKDDEIMLTHFATFMEGVGENNEITFTNCFPDRPLKSNTANGFSKLQLMSVYLLDDENLDKLKGAGSVLVGGVKEEIQVLTYFFLNQDDYSFDRELRIGDPGFEKWEDLVHFTSPLTDILIIDPYILKNTETETTTIDHNLIKLLEVLCNKSQSKVNIVILVNPSNLSYDIENVKDKIKSALTPILGKKPNVSFVKSFKEHDRTVITNYFRISGNTFNYWNERKQKINKGKEISIKTLAKREIHHNALKAYDDVQTIINFSDENDIIGDKVSNFLKF